MPRVVLDNDDCFDAFARLKDACVDAVITDPPYFLDKLKSEWEVDDLDKVTKSSQVSSLPAGMKFDPRQGREFQEFMERIAAEVFRVLKPGGFFLAFSAPRLFHRLGVAVEDAGFHVRDMWGWLYTQNQVKAMRVSRFLKKYELTEEQRGKLEKELEYWKTPQIKSCIEPITCAQKPPEGTFLENWMKHGVGLINTSARVGENSEMFPANILTAEEICGPLDRMFLVPKPNKAERGEFNKHISVKPLALMSQLVRLVTPEEATVLDPFSGSGSTGIAAVIDGRNYIGFELSGEYFEMSQKRFNSILGQAPKWKRRGTLAEASFRS